VETLKWNAERQRFLELARYRASDGGELFIPCEDPPSAGEEIRVEICFDGFAQKFAFQGSCLTARRKGRGSSFPSGATIRVEKADATGLIKALAFARGERIEYVNRAFPRHQSKVRVQLNCAAISGPSEIVDLSLGGARLGMEEGLPTMGEEVTLTVDSGGGFFPLKLKGQVMWLCFFEGRRGFGVKFTGGGLGWKRKLAELVEAASAGFSELSDESNPG